MEITAESPRIELKNSNVSLFPHQKAIIARMVALEKIECMKNKKKATLVNEDGHNFSYPSMIGVLADIPGSGKSFSMLGVILYERERQTQYIPPTILMVPTSLIEQWKNYISLIGFDSKRVYEALDFASVMNMSPTYGPGFDPFEYDIVLTTTNLYTFVQDVSMEVNWIYRIMIDEIDSVSDGMRDVLHCQKLWLVSASSDKTKFCVYANVMENLSFRVKTSVDFIRQSIIIPEYKDLRYKCDNRYITLLKSLMMNEDVKYKTLFSMKDPDFIQLLTKRQLRHIYCCDYSVGKYTHYKPNFKSTNTLEENLRIYLSSIVKNLAADFMYNQQALKNPRYCKNAIIYEEGRNVEQLLMDKLKLIRKLCAEQKLCAFCFKSVENQSAYIPSCCDGILHCQQCSNLPQCILCDADSDDHFRQIKIPAFFSKVISEYDDKDVTLERIINTKTSSNERVLIFSDFTESFEMIKHVLTKCKRTYEVILGTADEIQQSLNMFKNKETNCLIMNVRQQGAGINLEIADHCILLHVSDREEQIIGRAQRYGRIKPLIVHRLSYEGEKW